MVKKVNTEQPQYLVLNKDKLRITIGETFETIIKINPYNENELVNDFSLYDCNNIRITYYVVEWDLLSDEDKRNTIISDYM